MIIKAEIGIVLDLILRMELYYYFLLQKIHMQWF